MLPLFRAPKRHRLALRLGLGVLLSLDLSIGWTGLTAWQCFLTRVAVSVASARSLSSQHLRLCPETLAVGYSLSAAVGAVDVILMLMGGDRDGD